MRIVIKEFKQNLLNIRNGGAITPVLFKINEKLKEEYKKGYNQRLKDEGKTRKRWTHLYL